MPPAPRILLCLTASLALAAADPLPSWQKGPVKTAILDFVAQVITPGTKHYLPPEARIAVFDNDGTLWAEQPVYVQARYALDELQRLAPEHPEWRQREPMASLLAGDGTDVLTDEHAVLELIAATHAGRSVEDFQASVASWLATARHPETGRSYLAMTYRPMRELLDHLRANGFSTWIVSGGGVDFLRVFAESSYGIPPQQVIGSRLESRYRNEDGQPVIEKRPGLAFLDDGPGKPLAIQAQIGRRPILAAGNSDGDFEMLEWTTAGSPSLGLLLHHTDAEREWAYDRDSAVGRLDRALDAAPQRGWRVIDLARDWKTVFVAEPAAAAAAHAGEGAPSKRETGAGPRDQG